MTWAVVISLVVSVLMLAEYVSRRRAAMRRARLEHVDKSAEVAEAAQRCAAAASGLAARRRLVKTRRMAARKAGQFPGPVVR